MSTTSDPISSITNDPLYLRQSDQSFRSQLPRPADGERIPNSSVDDVLRVILLRRMDRSKSPYRLWNRCLPCHSCTSLLVTSNLPTRSGVRGLTSHFASAGWPVYIVDVLRCQSHSVCRWDNKRWYKDLPCKCLAVMAHSQCARIFEAVLLEWSGRSEQAIYQQAQCNTRLNVRTDFGLLSGGSVLEG